MIFAGLLVAFQNKVDRGGVREFRGAAKSAIFDVEKLRDGGDLRVDNGGVELCVRAGEHFGLSTASAMESAARSNSARLLRKESATARRMRRKSGPAHLIFRREISAAKKGPTVWAAKNR